MNRLLNRRDFLKIAGVAAGVGAASGLITDQVVEALAAPGLPSALRSPALSETRDPVAHVLNRVTFGPRPGQVDVVSKMGVQAYLEQQLNPGAIDDSASEKRLGDYITLDMTAAELQAVGAMPAEIIAELDAATLLRAVYSERQLFEVMVNFWSEHFSIWHYKEQCKILKTIDDREVVRKYALGKFRDILGASAKSPAMLIYLDNAKSDKQHPNENYAREVMELHTVTIGNYTEDDVKEVARCFTGWTVQGKNGNNPGEFIFRPGIHDNGPKTVLGHPIPAGGGINDGEIVLDILASHPATAQHLSSKLCRRFIGDDPPSAAVKAGAQAFTSSGGDIPTVLRAIFATPEFLSAPPKFKRPFEYLVSLFRAFDVQIEAPKPTRPQGLVPLAMLKAMGQLPFDRITPDGYTDYASLWIDNMLLRWNAAILTVYGVLPGVSTDLNGLVRGQNVELTPRGVLDYFAQHLLGRALSTVELDTIWGYVSKKGIPNLLTDAGRRRTGDAIALIAASPAFQYR
jgi:uncharacterized protein (DUF1800 family)